MPEMGFIGGLRNCHVTGLDSLVIKERASEEVGMARVFFARTGHGLKNVWNGGFFSVAPHNHRQDISLELLFGEVVNWNGMVGKNKYLILTEYGFQSGILGEMAVEPIGEVSMFLAAQYLRIGNPLFLPADNIHTVQVKSETAAWLVREGKKSSAPSRAYNPPGWKPSAEGLYVPMSQGELRKAEESLEKAMA